MQCAVSLLFCLICQLSKGAFGSYLLALWKFPSNLQTFPKIYIYLHWTEQQQWPTCKINQKVKGIFFPPLFLFLQWSLSRLFIKSQHDEYLLPVGLKGSEENSCIVFVWFKHLNHIQTLSHHQCLSLACSCQENTTDCVLKECKSKEREDFCLMPCLRVTIDTFPGNKAQRKKCADISLTWLVTNPLWQV